MTARIPPAAPPFGPDIQAALERTMPPGVPPLAFFTTLARDERLFKKLFAGGLIDRGNLSLRQREIVIDRTTALCGAEYEWGVHVAFFAKRVELSEAQLHSLVHGGAEDACWSPGDALLIRMCDALHASSTLSDALWAELKKDYSDAAMLELLMLAGQYRMISYLVNALKLPPETFAARFPARRA